jgi:hypothetical protein
MFSGLAPRSLVVDDIPSQHLGAGLGATVIREFLAYIDDHPCYEDAEGYCHCDMSGERADQFRYRPDWEIDDVLWLRTGQVRSSLKDAGNGPA